MYIGDRNLSQLTPFRVYSDEALTTEVVPYWMASSTSCTATTDAIGNVSITYPNSSMPTTQTNYENDMRIRLSGFDGTLSAHNNQIFPITDYNPTTRTFKTGLVYPPADTVTPDPVLLESFNNIAVNLSRSEYPQYANGSSFEINSDSNNIYALREWHCVRFPV